MSADPIEVKRAVARALKEKQKRLERAALESDLIYFMQSAWSAIEPGTFSLNWHHIEIAKALEQIRRGSLRNLVINIPPRCTKTLLVNVFYPAWLWAQSDIRPLSGPHVRFLCVSYGANLSEEIAVKMRRLIQTDWYQSHWSGRVQIAGDQQSRANFANTAGGERMSNSIEGGLLGRGGDIQICLPAYEIIHTEQGPLPIGYIVENKLSPHVWSYNEEQSTFELKSIVGWHTNPASDILEITTSEGNLHCTPDHRILTDQGWQRADSLVIDSNIYMCPNPPFANGQYSRSVNIESFCYHSRTFFRFKALANLFFRKFSQFTLRAFRTTVGLFNVIQVTPSGIASDRCNSSFRDSHSIRYFNCRFRRFKNLDNLTLSQNRLAFTLPARNSSVSFSIIDIILPRPVCEVFQSIVQFITVKMPTIVAKWFGSNESQQYKIVNPYGIASQIDPSITVPVNASFQDASFNWMNSLGTVPTSNCDSPRKRPNQSVVGRFIQPFISGNLPPLTKVINTEVIGHADHTYCLTIADNHNMLAGEGQLIIANCDDPHSLIGAESPVQRTATLEGMRSLTTRITDPRINARILVMQRLHCLLPGVAVRTPSGQKLVEELTTVDTVLGSNGWQQISATSTMPFKGLAYGVRLFGHPEVCWTTPNHCYLTKRGWQRADNLLRSDWVRFPLPVPSSIEVPWEEPRRALPPSAPIGNFTGKNLSISQERLIEFMDKGVDYNYIAKILNVHRATIHNHLWAYKIGRIREASPWFGRNHLSDPLFWRLIGYWLAEGCFMTRDNIIYGIRFTLHISETKYQDDIISTLNKYGVAVNKYLIPSSKTCQLKSNTSQLGRWLYDHFGSGARTKILPEFIFNLSIEHRKEILEGWLRGDGYIRQVGLQKGQRSGASSSIALIQGMQRLALSINQRVSIIIGRAHNKIVKINSWEGTVHKSWALRISPESIREHSMRSKIESDGIWYQIKSIQTKPYDGIVYDITTPSHDFVVGNATIHNTDDATNYALDHWDKPRLYMFPMRFDERRASAYDPRSIEGELLWPEVWNEDAVAREERELAAYGIAGQLQQNPVPRGGGIIGRDDWRVWPDEAPEAAGLTAVYECKMCQWKGYMPDIDADSISCPHCGSSAERAIPYPDFSFRLLSVDTSYGETQANSWSAATAWEVWHGKDGDPRAMLTYAWRGRPRLHEADGAIGLVERIHKIAQRRKSDVVLIEKKSRGVDLYNELARQSVEWPYRLEWFEPAGKGAGQIGESAKIMRLNAVVGLFTNNLVWAPKTDWAETVINEVADQPRAKYNDLCDTCSQALIYLRNAGYLTTGAEHKRDTARASVFRGRSSNNVSDEFEN